MADPSFTPSSKLRHGCTLRLEVLSLPVAMRFVLLSAPRSGSHLLQSYLMNHRQVYVHGELLNDEDCGVLPGPAKAYVAEHLCPHVSDRYWEGFILHAEQIAEREIDLGEFLGGLGCACVVLVYRRDLLAQFVSLVHAHRTGQWCACSDDVTAQEHAEPITVDEKELCEFQQQRRKVWTDAVNAIPQSMPVLTVVYEDLVKCPQGEMDRMFDALALSRIPQVHAYTVKQNTPAVQNRATLPQSLEQEQLDLYKELAGFPASVDSMQSEAGAADTDSGRRTGHDFRSTLCDHWVQNFFMGSESWGAAVSLSRDLSTAEGLPLGTKERYKDVALYIKRLIDSDDFDRTPVSAPWLAETVAVPAGVPGTTEAEVQQLLSWLVKEHRCKTVVELGSWLGQTTGVLAQALVDTHGASGGVVVAVDGFLWQHWMNGYTSQPMAPGRSFLKDFQANTKEYGDVVKALEVPVSGVRAHGEAWQHGEVDLVFFDITQDAEELWEWWEWLEPRLARNRAVLVVHGYGRPGVCAFLHRLHGDLQPLHKPHALCKAFLFNKEWRQSSGPVEHRRLCFQPSPSDWDHHHMGGWVGAVAGLREELHHPRAPTLFLPAVEQHYCEKEGLPSQPWVGVMHQAFESSTKWVPDGQRCLTDPVFLRGMQCCKGLLTLSENLAQTLRLHMPAGLSVPITSIKYPLPVPNQVFDVNAALSMPEGLCLVMVGSYMRDYEPFLNLQLSSRWAKYLRTDDEVALPPDSNVNLLPKLTGEEYEAWLNTSIMFVSMLVDGVANTLVVECILRRTPIVARRTKSLEEYLGHDYPLFFDELQQAQSLLADDDLEQRLRGAHTYLCEKSIGDFTVSGCLRQLTGAPLFKALPCAQDAQEFCTARISVMVCSYKRTQNLKDILQALLEAQDVEGPLEVIVWNNSEDRRREVDDICISFRRKQSRERRIEVIHSSTNYYCGPPRLAAAMLIRSEDLLICDDDMLPQRNFVSGFLAARCKYGERVVLCLHGHKFLPHLAEAPGGPWGMNGFCRHQKLRFQDDLDPEDEIHFAHLDAALVPRALMQQAAKIPMPDPTFALVDDYWLSFVWSHHLGCKLVKLKPAQKFAIPHEGSHDAEVALYLNPRVQSARQRLYDHHISCGWPAFALNHPVPPQGPFLDSLDKVKAWDCQLIGFNVELSIGNEALRGAWKLGASVLRIGAIGRGNENCLYFLRHLNECTGAETARCLKRVTAPIDRMEQLGLRVVVTLHRDVASPCVWGMLARELQSRSCVIGYDLINEPCTPLDEGGPDSCCDNPATDVANLVAEYGKMAQAIRAEDPRTPIILSSSFWGARQALPLLLGALTKEAALQWDRLMVTFHMYEPRQLTCRWENCGKFGYPGVVPNFRRQGPWAPKVDWGKQEVESRMAWAQGVLDAFGIPRTRVFVGEVGIARDTRGAEEYLADVLTAIQRRGWHICLYAFREHGWQVMDYELGPDIDSSRRDQNNPLFEPIRKALEAARPSGDNTSDSTQLCSEA